MLTHVLCLRWGEGHGGAAGEARTRLEALVGVVPSLRSLVAGPDVVRSDRSWDFALVATFDDRAGLDAYATHPAHVEVAEWLRERRGPVAVVDFEA